MNFIRLIKRSLILLIALSAFTAFQASAAKDHSATKQTRTLGVLALQGVPEAYAQWQGLITHLNQQLNEYQFELRALNFDEINGVVANKEIDYLIANSAYFVDLRHKYDLHAIATLNRQRNQISSSEFGGLVVTLPHIHERQILNKAKLKIAAVAPLSFGGYLTQKFRLIDIYDLNPEDHSIQYFYQHNDVLNAMRSGIFDIGFVRTGVYEQHPEKTGLKPIFLNQEEAEQFPLEISTYLYPEWPFARLKHITLNEAKRVLPTLLNWSSSYKQELLSWSTPLDYQPVDDLFKTLRLPPYANGQASRPVQAEESATWLITLAGLLLLISSLWLLRYVQQCREKTARQVLQQKSAVTDKQIKSDQQHLQVLNTTIMELKALADNAASGLLIVDANKQIRFANRTLRAQLDYHADELQGMSLAHILPELEQRKISVLNPNRKPVDNNPAQSYPAINLITKNRRSLSLQLNISEKKIAGQFYFLLMFRDTSEQRKASQELLNAQLISKFYLQNTTDIVFSFTDDLILQTLNPNAIQLFAFNENAATHLNWVTQFVNKEEQDELILQLNEVQRTDTSNEFSRTLKIESGEDSYELTIHISHIKDSRLEQPFFLCTANYVDAQLHSQCSLGINEQSFDNVVTKNQAGILMVNEKGTIEMANPAAQKLLGRSSQQLLGSYFGTPVLSDQGDHTEFDLINPDGSIGVAEVTFSKTEWHGEPAYLVMMYDITQLKEAQKLIEHQAFHDALTGLPNRRLLNELLQQTIARHQRSQAPFALLFLDIDGFKKVNDSEGHQVGDMLLIQVAQRIQNVIRKSDIFARMGGDEFTIITEENANKTDIETVAENIIQQFDSDFEVEGRSIHISISIGIALYPLDAHDSADLLKMADLAMYQAKKQISKNYDFFQEGLLESFKASYNLETGLKKALANHEFELYYQPQVDANSGQLKGMEALIRWNHPEQGMVRPDQFIPILENSGLIIPVGAWVLEEAIQQLKQWMLSCKEDRCARMSVNVSALQLIDEDFVNNVKSTLKKHDLTPTRLAIEITESILIGNKQKVLQQLEQLTNLGIQVHMDDFGTGYSSMAMLAELPFDVIKIDQSFVKNILDDPRERTMVKAIVDTVHAFDRMVLVEGVELEEQRQILAELGCNEIQGYLFDKPLTAEEFRQKYIEGKDI